MGYQSRGLLLPAFNHDLLFLAHIAIPLFALLIREPPPPCIAIFICSLKHCSICGLDRTQIWVLTSVAQQTPRFGCKLCGGQALG
jgi:hypothetical protein